MLQQSQIRLCLATQYLNKETKGTDGQFLSGYTARCEHFTTRREFDKEAVDGLFQAEEAGNKYLEAFLREKLVEDKKSFFQPFF